jgi:hypothetical protein
LGGGLPDFFMQNFKKFHLENYTFNAIIWWGITMPPIRGEQAARSIFGYAILLASPNTVNVFGSNPERHAELSAPFQAGSVDYFFRIIELYSFIF